MYEKKVREAIYCMKSFVDEAVCEECDYYETCDHTRAEENAKIAIKALEKQLPKKPKKTGDLACSCGLIIQRKNRRTCLHYCHNCGQAIDWSE